MANNYPTATVSVSFSTSTTEEDAVLVAEILPEDNNGITTFPFNGAPPKFRVYKSPNISEIHLFSSTGSITQVEGNKKAEFVENITFVGGLDDSSESSANAYYRQASVAKPVIGEYTISNIIGNIGVVSLVEEGKTTFQCSKESTGPLDPVVGFCRISYSSRYNLYTLSGVGKPAGFGENGFSNYEVIVHIVGIVR